MANAEVEDALAVAVEDAAEGVHAANLYVCRVVGIVDVVAEQEVLAAVDYAVNVGEVGQFEHIGLGANQIRVLGGAFAVEHIRNGSQVERAGESAESGVHRAVLNHFLSRSGYLQGASADGVDGSRAFAHSPCQTVVCVQRGVGGDVARVHACGQSHVDVAQSLCGGEVFVSLEHRIHTCGVVVEAVCEACNGFAVGESGRFKRRTAGVRAVGHGAGGEQLTVVVVVFKNAR